MTKLSKAQAALLKRLHVAPVEVYGADWKVFYALKARGFAYYMKSDDDRHNYRYAVITPDGVTALAEVA